MSKKLKNMKKIEEIVGADRVSIIDDELSKYRSAGLTSGGNPLAIVRPVGTREVKDLIQLSRTQGYNLIFTSSTSAKYRGDSIPSGDGIIVDMSKMKKIVHMDKRNKVAIIEPGVTFSELIEEADKVDLKVLMPLLPQQGKSVLASYLEREPIQIPKYHWDMTDPQLCTEMVFGTGDLFRTGTAASPGNLKQQWAANLVQKNPVGPAATDFLRIVQGSQGTLAAVTWCSVKMEVKPSIHKIYFAPSNKLDRLVDITYRALRPKLGDEWFIMNACALAGVIADDPQKIKTLAKKQAQWTLIYGVSGHKYFPDERVATQEEELTKIIQASGTHIVPEVPGCSWKKMERILASPSPEPYYKTIPKGGFLDIFFLTTLDKAASFIKLMEEDCEKYNYPQDELGIYIQPIQHGRSIHLEFTLYYNPSDKADAGKAKGLFEEASRDLDKAGAFYSRPYGTWSDIAYANCPDTVEALKKIKGIMDPDNILNRGKLCFQKEEVA
jgi:FAD/FMN-containing dehydrogenase